jgi:hypothetical protein
VKRLSPETYFAVARAQPGAQGAYTLTLRIRQRTSTTIKLRPAGLQLNQLYAIARVMPATTGGRVTFELEQFDPLTHWHFVSAITRTVEDGAVGLYLTPRAGGWRLRARFLETLASSPGSTHWISFAIETTQKAIAGAKRPAARACSPDSNVTLALNHLAVTCTTKGFASAPPGPQDQGVAVEISELRALVTSIAMLKDPFKSDLLADLDAASDSFFYGRSEEAGAKIEGFLTQLQQAPLQAELSSDQHTQLVQSATRIRTALGAS